MIELRRMLLALRGSLRRIARFRVRTLMLIVLLVALGFGGYRVLAEREKRRRLAEQYAYWSDAHQSYRALIRDAEERGRPDLVRSYQVQSTRAAGWARYFHHFLSGGGNDDRPPYPGETPASRDP